MPKLIVFTEVGYNGIAKEFTSNDPDLTLNGDDATFKSAIVLSGSWTLYPETASQGTPISLGETGGPDGDGGYKDHADWGGVEAFHVKSIAH
jgi:Beta/Gamma crystallin